MNQDTGPFHLPKVSLLLDLENTVKTIWTNILDICDDEDYLNEGTIEIVRAMADKLVVKDDLGYPGMSDYVWKPGQAAPIIRVNRDFYDQHAAEMNAWELPRTLCIALLKIDYDVYNRTNNSSLRFQGKDADFVLRDFNLRVKGGLPKLFHTKGNKPSPLANKVYVAIKPQPDFDELMDAYPGDIYFSQAKGVFTKAGTIEVLKPESFSFECFDSYSQDAMNLYMELESVLRHKQNKKWANHAYRYGLAVLQSVVLKKSCQGQGIGWEAIVQTLKTVPGFGMVVLKAEPLPFGSGTAKSRKKLVDHYTRMGFELLAGSDNYMAMEVGRKNPKPLGQA